MEQHTIGDVKAEALRVLVDSDIYSRTIGKWIEDGLSHSLQQVMTLTDLDQLRQAQGRWQAYQDIKDQISLILEKAEARKLRKLKTIQAEGIAEDE